MVSLRPRLSVVLIAGLGLAACRGSAADRLAANGISPIYNAQTGRLEALVSDRDHDGRPETRARMDGGTITSIEIDRNGDGVPDRWEYYNVTPNVIDHAEEANGPGPAITRREFYVDGVIRRVVDDTDLDGRPDKWEFYERGTLVSVEVDLLGHGFASQRLVYSAAGEVDRVETDPDGDGVFVRAPQAAAARGRNQN